ncbi:hypothetical protein FA13DRAFT_1760462 [Coprinellus micaceus]|uniref:RRM domain-containing protein n=1 Tax=Coprinellus micaceus TaxID=71717 RepID=A0A4Y7R5U0_COPMI|nr:hypothetical protein FA13DRAFT_1760462 [Coprinellus micaceus]
MEGDYGHQEGEFQGPHLHPYLHDPLLYITNLPTFPEKALATLQGRPIPELTQTVPLLLSPYPSTNPPTPLPPPSAQPRLVKQLPPNYTDSQLYDLFREFGALCFSSQEAMHCAEVEGQNIVVQVYQPPRRTSASFGDFNPAAAAFVPGGSSFYSPYPNQYSPHSPHSPPRGSPYHSRSPLPGSPYLNKSPLPSPIPFQVQYAGSGSHSGLIDPCNLFCKNLDPEIDSNSLFTHFRRFGQICSSGSKQIVVRLHEPKQMRQEKLAQRFGHNNHPRSASGATSPTISEAGDWGSPRTRSTPLGPGASPGPKHQDTRARRGQEVLSGEFSRRIQDLNIALSNLALSDVIQTMDNPDKLKEQVELRRKLTAQPTGATEETSRPVSSIHRTPISVSATLSTPPRTSSPSGSVPPQSERERMLAAVNKLENARQEELTELLMGLPKRERAMCLFNSENLRAKLVDAKAILEADDDDEGAEQQTPATVAAPKPIAPAQEVRPAASPAPATPGSGTAHTITTLAKLPAAEIIRLANSSSATGLPLPKADPLVVQATDEFIDSLLDQTVLVQKQKLGDKLYKVVKSFGLKGAPKVTIHLLDQEDLRALAHLMNSYPSVLKEKALNVHIK